MKSSSLEIDEKRMVLPSNEIKKVKRKKVKLWEMLLDRCQNLRGELELEILFSVPSLVKSVVV